jgi:uncharacterized protein (TIGR03435 family)
MALLMVSGSLVHGQERSDASAGPPEAAQPLQRDYRFEVASIRPGPPDGRLTGPSGPSYTPGHFREEVTSIYGLAYFAFGKKQAFELEGPEWMYRTYFNVNATLPEGATKADLPIMVRHLLEDRFGLKFHHVSREVAGYELVVAKSGPKVEKQAGPTSDSLSGPGPGFQIKDGVPEFGKDTGSMSGCSRGWCWYHGHNRTMHALAADLASRLKAPVADATGLEGGYDYTVIYTAEVYSGPASNIVSPLPVGPPPGQAAAGDGAAEPMKFPMLPNAVREQLGLELRSVKKVPVDVVVLDSANKEPTEN